MYPQKKFETKFNNGKYKLCGITDLYGEKIKVDTTGKIANELISIELKYTSTVKNAWKRYIKSVKGVNSITGLKCTIENKYNLQAGFPGIVDPSIICYLLVIHSDNKITLTKIKMKRDVYERQYSQKVLIKQPVVESKSPKRSKNVITKHAEKFQKTTSRKGKKIFSKTNKGNIKKRQCQKKNKK